MIGLLYLFDGLESEFEWCCWESEVYVRRHRWNCY